jgi:DNA-binding response OmpR family regulator
MITTLNKRISTRNVLHLENQRNWQALLASALAQSEQINLNQCAKVGWAQSELEQKQYDLVLVDLHLNHGEHGNVFISHVLQNCPRTRIALMSGTLSDSARKKIEELELGLLYIPKDELLSNPDRVRAKVEFIINNDFPCMRDQRALEAILNEEITLNAVPNIHSEIDALKPDLFAFQRYLSESLSQGQTRDKVLSLTEIPYLYGSDERESFSRLHEYKGQLAIAVAELEAQRNEQGKEVYRSMQLILSRIMTILDTAHQESMINLKDAFHRETSRLKQLYSDVLFKLDETPGQDSRGFYVSQGFRESLRILLSNAAEAYDGCTEKKEVKASLFFSESQVRSQIILKIENAGRKLPRALLKERLYSEDVVSTKPTGTQFGLSRVLELGERDDYDLCFRLGENDETITRVALNPSAYQIRRVKEKDTPLQKGKVLLVDHSRIDYRYLEEMLKKSGYPVEYIWSAKRFHDIAAQYAKEYCCVILHPTAGYVDNARLMKEKNPTIGLMVCSGYDGWIAQANNLFPRISVRAHMPRDEVVKRWVNRQFSRYLAYSDLV